MPLLNVEKMKLVTSLQVNDGVETMKWINSRRWEQEQATPNEEHSKRVKIDGLGHGKKSSNMGRDI